MKSSLGLIYNYIQLCAAIVNSGIKQNDQVFLKSEWCKELTDYIIDYNNEHNSSHVNLMLHKRIGGRDE